MMYGSQQQQFKDLNLPYPPPAAPNSGHRKDEEVKFYEQNQQMSSGLLRYRSAPSNLLGEFCEDLVPCRPETDRILPTFLEPIQFVYGNEDLNSDKANNNYNSGLIRQSSSPAGLFAQLNTETGFGMIRGFRNANSPSGNSVNRLKGQLSFSSSRQNSIMSQISEVETEDGCSPEENGSVNQSFIPGFPIGSWDESSFLSENFSGLKHNRDGEVKIVSGLTSSEHQNGKVPALTHQFSLPKTSSEMATIEKFLQLQDAVPCKMRAKRGCATHPRSIAERVRRTRISERMRKLQELVPNMDKQTNTADMLDLAVDYIKDLQKQVKTLSDARPCCTCTCSGNKHKNFLKDNV